jgi:hypothetical protein
MPPPGNVTKNPGSLGLAGQTCAAPPGRETRRRYVPGGIAGPGISALIVVPAGSGSREFLSVDRDDRRDRPEVLADDEERRAVTRNADAVDLYRLGLLRLHAGRDERKRHARSDRQCPELFRERLSPTGEPHQSITLSLHKAFCARTRAAVT